jgi:hypothetical protein
VVDGGGRPSEEQWMGLEYFRDYTQKMDRPTVQRLADAVRQATLEAVAGTGISEDQVRCMTHPDGVWVMAQ